MTPEELEELRALVGRLNCTAYDENLAVVLGAALEHIDQQAAQIAEYRKPMESMDTEQLTDWNVKLTELLSATEDEREYLPWQIAVGDHLEKFAKSWLSSRIAELEYQIIHQMGISACRIEERDRLQKQIVALQEIAVDALVEYNLSWKDCVFRAPSTHCEKTNGYCVTDDCPFLEDQKQLARRQLAEEHPEAFR